MKEYKDRDNRDRGDRGDRDGGYSGGYSKDKRSFDRAERDGEGSGRRGFSRRRQRPPVDLVLDYKDPYTLRQFVSEEGRIVPARICQLSAKQQRQLAQEVKRARQLALLPVADTHTRLRG